MGSVQEKHCFHIVFAEKIAYNDIRISMGRGNELEGRNQINETGCDHSAAFRVSTTFRACLPHLFCAILNKSKYEIHAVGITREGRVVLSARTAIADRDRVRRVGEHERPRSGRCCRPTAASTVWCCCREGETEIVRLDCVFPVLHGVGGEDGTMQGRARAGRHSVRRLRRSGEREHDGQVADQKGG